MARGRGILVHRETTSHAFHISTIRNRERNIINPEKDNELTESLRVTRGPGVPVISGDPASQWEQQGVFMFSQALRGGKSVWI